MPLPPARAPFALDEDLSRALERIAAAQHELLAPGGDRTPAAGLIDKVARLLPYVIYVFDIKSRRTLYLNRHMALDLGWTVEEIQAMDEQLVAALLHPEDLARVPELFARWDTTPDGATLETEYRLRAKSGAWRWHRSRDTIFARDADGSVRLLLGTLEDVTEERALNERLMQLQRYEALGRLAGGVAHDFNNFLTRMLGSVSSARAALAAGETPERQLEEIAATCRMAGELTQHLVHFSQGRPTRPERVDAEALLDELRDPLRGVLGPRVALELQVAPGTGPVRIERPLLVQVIVNLAMNARDAMPEGGSFRLRVRPFVVEPGTAGELPVGRYVRLEVQDEGVGMDPLTRRHAFEPFFTTKEAPGGAGLGLASVWGIVLAAGGWIHVESEPGRGTVFVIDLPGAEEEASAAPPPPSPRRAAPSGRLLLVEDDPDVADVIVDSLSDLELEIVRTHDGEHALALLDEDPRGFDALVSDLTLPGTSGCVVANEFRARRPGGALVLVSGWAERSQLGPGSLPPDAVFLAKPFSPDDLRAAVSEQLARSGGSGDAA
jgi:PAS domain S-box-containing protein